ncbi:hypothetical protein BDZ85DRAFT_263074 [Elsinoe ampelina]|uniref:Uncharacterized protein n=1 Tax=Elsinoe ampelina TaxID=302913 RepID=A0A6A6GC00_9PEZI|nr:hypothetical protein BDZ85DRAFT_263074 [Elsinoe ampelina]
MSTKQKSFFDQKSKKSVRNFHSYRKHADDRGATYRDPVPVRRSAIAASEEAKSKLGAYKLNMAPIASPQRSQGKENSKHFLGQSPMRKNCSFAAEVDAKNDTAYYLPPSTPAVRLPLADLLGNNEEIVKELPQKEDSPELNWVTNSQHPDFTPGKRRKRAASSSPATSSQNEASSHFGPRAPLDLHQIQQALKTPKADPAADLWTRYNALNDSEDHAVARLPSLAHLLQDSSPQSLPRTPGGSIGGLRRWASCGNEWPASKSKRRRTNGVFRDRDQSSHEDALPSREHSNGSRLGAMVDRVQANLAHEKPAKRLQDPSSSSPLPDKGSFDSNGPESPVNRAASRSSNARTSHGDHVQAPAAVSNPTTTDEADQSSDYGDDNIDLDEFALDEASPAGLRSESKGGQVDICQDSGYQEESEAIDNSHGGDSHNIYAGHLPTIDEESDEFGEDDDITAEDLETALTQIEKLATQKQRSSNIGPQYDGHNDQSRAERPSIKNRPAPKFTSNDHDDDDDEFGELDADEESFAAAEIAATQAYRASVGSQASVRQSNIPRV